MKRVPKRNRTIQEKVAIISAIGIITAALISQSPTWYEAWKERPIVDVSLGGLGTEYPKIELQNDGTNYYVEIIAENRGKYDGKLLYVINATNTKISFNENGPWEYQQSYEYTNTSTSS